jgi:predicted small secreted protein
MAAMTRIFVLLVLLFSLVFMTACNTIHGMGQDVRSAGRAIERSSGK